MIIKITKFSLKIIIAVLLINGIAYSFAPDIHIEPQQDHKYFFYYKIYDESNPQLYFVINDPTNHTTVTYDKDFFTSCMLEPEHENYNTLLKINSFGYDFKHNVIPYINPIAAVRLFYILEKLGSELRITDAFRTSEQQDSYKKRRWTPLDVSPHQLGLALDIPPYYITNPGMIENLCNQLSLRYLVHGRRGNRHLHINDISMWTTLTPEEISSISGGLCESLPQYNYSELFDLRKGSSIMKFISSNYNNIYELDLNSENITSVKIIIKDIYSRKTAEIYGGVFEKGNTRIKLDMSFLKKGNYIITVENDEKPAISAFFPVK